MSYSKQELEEMAQAVPFWYHSIDLGQNVITKGSRSASQLADDVHRLRLPDLRGKSVLDINAWDGFYSFAAERSGAARVVALDHYMWAMDLGQHIKYWTECKERGITPAPYHTMPYYKPNELPGKVGFDAACAALHSGVEAVVGDFMEMDLRPLGTFDVVLYLGSLYHMQNPLLALQRVAAVTKEVAVIETEAAAFIGFEQRAVCEFFESNELNGDVSNWWAPNEKALAALCRAAGFRKVDIADGSPLKPTLRQSPKNLLAKVRFTGREVLRRSLMKSEARKRGVIRYRAIAHAWK